jgi:hypothetical protein
MQSDLLEWSKGKNVIPVEADLALGKTGAGVLLCEAKAKRTLAVVPKNTFRHWVAETYNFTGLSAAAATGSKQRKIATLMSPVDIVFINPESVSRLKKEITELVEAGIFDCLLIDELTRWRRWSEQTKALTKIAKHLKVKIALTGRVVTEQLEDIFNPARILWGKASPFGDSVFSFRTKYFSRDPEDDYKLIPTEYGKKTVSRVLARKFFRAYEEDYFEDVEKPVFYTRNITLTEEQKGLLGQLRDDWEVKIGNYVEEIDYVTAQIIKAHQVISGFIYMGEGKSRKTHYFNYNPKIQALTSMLEEIGNKPVVIWCVYEAERALLKQLMKTLGKQVCTEENWHEFNNGTGDVFISTYKKSGQGIELQRASNAILFSRTMDHDLYRQALGRTRRQPKWNCTYQILETNAIVDKLITKLLKTKQSLMTYIKAEGLDYLCQLKKQNLY